LRNFVVFSREKVVILSLKFFDRCIWTNLVLVLLYKSRDITPVF
jgi:hypothetical protein